MIKFFKTWWFLFKSTNEEMRSKYGYDWDRNDQLIFLRGLSRFPFIALILLTVIFVPVTIAIVGIVLTVVALTMLIGTIE